MSAGIRVVCITVLVKNICIEEFTPFAEVGEASWDRVMDVNLTAPGTQIDAAGMVHYTASKGDVTSMTRSLAAELGPRGSRSTPLHSASSSLRWRSGRSTATWSPSL